MKQVMLGLFGMSLVLAACGSKISVSDSSLASAARSKNEVLTANLTDLSLDKLLPASGSQGALLTYDVARKDLLILIPTCPQGAKCIWAGPMFNAAVTSDVVDSCNIRTIVALTDKRPVDGSLTEISVTDASLSVCNGGTELTKLIVVLKTKYYDRLGQKEVSTYSTLSGNDGLAPRLAMHK
ncbi:MAG: hypothetical protein NTV34_13090 [Proteobacteria bacterium]|nr:hypothetical protein [Pseudomonadota bacterium]